MLTHSGVIGSFAGNGIALVERNFFLGIGKILLYRILYIFLGIGKILLYRILYIYIYISLSYMIYSYII